MGIIISQYKDPEKNQSVWLECHKGFECCSHDNGKLTVWRRISPIEDDVFHCHLSFRDVNFCSKGTWKTNSRSGIYTPETWAGLGLVGMELQVLALANWGVPVDYLFLIMIIMIQWLMITITISIHNGFTGEYTSKIFVSTDFELFVLFLLWFWIIYLLFVPFWCIECIYIYIWLLVASYSFIYSFLI